MTFLNTYDAQKWGPQQAAVDKLHKFFRTQKTHHRTPATTEPQIQLPYLSAQAWEPAQPAEVAGRDCLVSPRPPTPASSDPAARVSPERKFLLLFLPLPTTPWQQTLVPQVTEERTETRCHQHGFSHPPRALTYVCSASLAPRSWDLPSSTHTEP